MESQPQSPELRDIHKNFRSCSYISHPLSSSLLFQGAVHLLSLQKLILPFQSMEVGVTSFCNNRKYDVYKKNICSICMGSYTLMPAEIVLSWVYPPSPHSSTLQN